MPQEALNPIVQRMIDAGESEDNIATVIRHYKAQASVPTAVSPSEPGTFMGGAAQSIRDTMSKVGSGIVQGLNPLPALKGILNNGTDALPYQPNDTPSSAVARLKAHDAPGGPSMMEAAKSLSDPETGGRALGNIGQVLIAGRLVSAAQNPAARAGAGKALGMVGDFDLSHPLKSTIGKVAEALQRSGETPPAAQVPAPLTPPAAPAALSDLELAKQEVAAGRLPPSAIAAIEKAQQSPRTPPGMVRGQLRPVAASPESPLQQPRMQVGAEVVGRQNGLSKEAVRQQTAPILNEAPGEASPVFPQKPFERMHDTLKALPRGSAEREAYVKSAADPKTAGLLEAMRRTLERNGLALGGMTSAEALRRAVMARLSAQGSDQ